MKVALLSFHNAHNYGAALQAYALQRAVEQLGVECEYIDYVNEFRMYSYDMGHHLKDALSKKNYLRAVRLACGMPFMNARGKRFDQFYRTNLKQTKKQYHTSEELTELTNDYEKFIVGSDQVWNHINNGNDWAYLLDFVQDDKKKISYSSSFGLSNIPEKYRSIYAANLLSFERISTRESIGVRLIDELTGRKANLVLDPVFLPGRQVWDKVKESGKSSSQKFIFFYTNRKSQIQDFLDSGYSIENLKMHVLSSHVDAKDFLNLKINVKFSIAPEQFLREISEAELVVTASFHCLAFALIFHKPFVAILTGDQGKDERILNLLKITGLESRILTDKLTPEEIASPIDYEKVDELIEPFMEFSKLYLKNAIFSYPATETAPVLPEIDADDARFCMDNRCVGCGACAAICPYDAIEMISDDEGFLIPVVNESLCVHCGACHRVCPVFNEAVSNKWTQRFFAVKNSDETRRKSSSGGVFTALSDAILADGGAIVGAVMNDDFRVVHTVAKSATERDQMRATFYVQSDLADVLSRTKEILDDGKKVLFVGTPCQIHGLKLYLKKEYELLYTCDLVCHGTPSPLAFSSFIDDLKTRGTLTKFQFRDKSLGWKGYHVSAQINGKKVSNKLWLQSFNNLFSHNVINRPSCAQCPYASYDRVGDITIADFWGVHTSLPGFADELGVSLVLTNSFKGEELFRQLSTLTTEEVMKAQTHQNSLLRPSTASGNRKNAFRLLRQKGYRALAKSYGENNIKGYLKNVLRKLYLKTLATKR